jgi:hypothetical protein
LDTGVKLKGKSVYWIKSRKERSDAAERFIRLLDQKREEEARMDPRRCWWERQRCVSNISQESEFLVLPEHVPIDYFKPEIFNQLQPQLQHHATSTKIALLPDVEQSFTMNQDERLSDIAFFEKYNDSVL